MVKHHFRTLADYAQSAAKTDRFEEDRQSLDRIRYGFFGEVGGLLASVKKSSRDMFGQSEDDSASEEIGDALWYLCAIIRREKFSMEEIGEATIKDLEQHLSTGPSKRTRHSITFHEIDGLLAYQSKQIPESKDELLYRLASITGKLFAGSDYAPNNATSVASIEFFASLLGTLAMIASKFDLKLSAIAEANLRKNESRWPADAQNPKYLPLFDDDSEEHEKFPRKFCIHFIERNVKGKQLVIQQMSGVNIGDPLSDNRTNSDDYRFHDVFHLAYIAHLGWSPVVRGLLKLKRKSQPHIDENEDGARAMIIEEGIATWIFNHARSRDYFEGITAGKLEYAMLKQVQSMVSGYEVDKCPLWQWERAIIDGFSVFRQLRIERGGIVNVNLREHTIEFKSLEKAAS